MPHVFNEEKGQFEQTHYWKVPQPPSQGVSGGKKVKKRLRNQEYTKFLLQCEREHAAKKAD